MSQYAQSLMISRGSRDGNRQVGNNAGQVSYESTFYDSWKGLVNQWYNDTNDFVSGNAVAFIPSPYATYGAPSIISSISKAAPAVVTTGAAHGLSNGDKVLIVGTDTDFALRSQSDTDLGGTLNGRVYTVRESTTTSFTLDSVDTSSFLNTCSQGFAIKVTTKTGYDPTSDLSSALGKITSAETAIDAIDPEGATGDYYDAVTRGISLADDIVTDDEIDTAIEEYTEDIDSKYAERSRSMLAGMVDIGASNGSGYMMAMASLESERRREISKFRSNLLLQKRQEKMRIAHEIAKDIIAYQRFAVEEKRAVAHTFSEQYRLQIALESEAQERDRNIALKDSLWALDRYQYGYNALAAIFGSVGPVASQEGYGSSGAFGQAMSYASLGASIGSVVPGAGTGIGAAIGAGVGAIGSLFD